jgi:hypothetical protein
MFDEPNTDAANYAGGGIVAFGSGGTADDPPPEPPEALYGYPGSQDDNEIAQRQYNQDYAAWQQRQVLRSKAVSKANPRQHQVGAANFDETGTSFSPTHNAPSNTAPQQPNPAAYQAYLNTYKTPLVFGPPPAVARSNYSALTGAQLTQMAQDPSITPAAADALGQSADAAVQAKAMRGVVDKTVGSIGDMAHNVWDYYTKSQGTSPPHAAPPAAANKAPPAAANKAAPTAAANKAATNAAPTAPRAAAPTAGLGALDAAVANKDARTATVKARQAVGAAVSADNSAASADRTLGGLGSTAAMGDFDMMKDLKTSEAFVKANIPDKHAAQDAYADYIKQTTSPEAMQKRKGEDFWSTIAQMGFGMAASKSPFALQAAGEAASAAMPEMQKKTEQRRADALTGMKALSDIEGKSRDEAVQILQLSYGMSKENADAFYKNKTIAAELEKENMSNVSAEKRTAATIAGGIAEANIRAQVDREVANKGLTQAQQGAVYVREQALVAAALSKPMSPEAQAMKAAKKAQGTSFDSEAWTTNLVRQRVNAAMDAIGGGGGSNVIDYNHMKR